MKNIFTFVSIVVFTIQLSKAQDFPLLLIDSTYQERNTVNTSIGIIDSFYAFTGYSYDEDDRLVQTRRRTIINSYTYLPNLTIINSESKNSDGDWEVRGRTTINEEGDIKTTTVEIINNGAWLNLVKGTVFYNAEGYDSLTLTDVGINGEWVQELSLIHIPSPRDKRQSRMPSSA